MEQISLTGATLLSDYPGGFSQIELTNPTTTTTSSSTSHSHDHNGHHDHGHNHNHDGSGEDSCPHHRPTPPLLLTTHPQIQALPANIPALVEGGTNSELFEALCTFIRLARTLEERNGWFKSLLEELKKQTTPSSSGNTATTTNTNTSSNNRLWQVLSTTSPDDNGHTLFHWAAKRSDDPRFLQLLLEYASQSILPNNNNNKNNNSTSTTTISSSPTPTTTTKSSLPNAIQSPLFLNIINQASVDSVGMTPLHWACTEHCQRHVQLLLQYGANIDSTDQSGCTPLLIAAQYGHVDLVAILLRRGANGMAVDKSLDTALHWAAYKGSMPVCGVLTFLCPQLSYTTPDSFGQTPLHLAALRGHTSVVRYILANVRPPIEDNTNRNNMVDDYYNDDDDEDDDDDEESGLLLSKAFLSTTTTTSSTTASSSLRNRRHRQRLLQFKTKEDLLWLRDSQGRTPLELAIFKQRPTVAAVLQHEMDQCKLQQVYHSTSTPYTRKLYLWLQYNVKVMCSIHNWKVWMGIRTKTADAQHHLDDMDESPKFPFYIVVALMIVQVVCYPALFTPLFAVDQGILWDLMGWHLLNWLFMICLWYSFYKIATTSPGYVGGAMTTTTTTTMNANKNINHNRTPHHHHRGTTTTSSSSTTTTRAHVDSKPSRRRHRPYSQAALTRKWRHRYEQVLDSYAQDDYDNDESSSKDVVNEKDKLKTADVASSAAATAAAAAAAKKKKKMQALRDQQLCHTCHIARPLRSKHCRVARRCVLMFDHHCPFVGNTIGLYNYMWFYLTLVFMTLCELGFIITWALYLFRYTSQQHHPMPWKIVWLGVVVAVWILPAAGMTIYHTQLCMVNLTTNEHQNLARYKYLHDPVTGRYRNPWFQGWFWNMVQRFNPSEACYTLPDDDDVDNDDNHDGHQHDHRHHHEAIIQQV